MRDLRRPMLALLTALAVLLPGGALAQAQYFCRMMGRVAPSCCCRATHGEPRDSSCDARVRPRDCCERIATTGPAALASTRESPASVPAAACVAAAPQPIHAYPSVRTASAPALQARAPPALGPPLFIAHRSLLI